MESVSDNLIASSVLRGLKNRYDKLEVISQRPHHVVFENNNHIDKLTVLSDGDLPKVQDQWQEWHYRRSKEYDAFFHLSHSIEARHALVKGQTDFWHIAEYRRKICAGSYLETAADICGLPYAEACRPQFFPTNAELDQAYETLEKVGQRCVGWVVSGSRIDKIYPFAAAVISRIIRDLGVPVILFGAPKDDGPVGNLIAENVRIMNGSIEGLHLAISTLGAEEELWPIRRVLTQVMYCDVVVGPDTGPMWAVACEPMPKVLLLSHASVENIAKHWVSTVVLHADPIRVPCWPCHRLHDSIDSCVPNKWNSGVACISDMTSAQVFDAVCNVLSDPGVVALRAAE